MSEIFRFGVSLPKDLIDKFDKFIKEKSYTNRSKAFGDLIRQELVKKECQEGKKIQTTGDGSKAIAKSVP